MTAAQKPKGKKKAQPYIAKPRALTSKIHQVYGNGRDAGFNKPIQQRWEDLRDISDAIASLVATMAESINETVELVKVAGCDHPAEFAAVVKKTNEDYLKFVDDFLLVKSKHEGKTGKVNGPDELALMLRVFEDYQQFRAKFDGVMYHTQISFTEYALEAKDRLLAMEQKQQAEDKENTDAGK